MNKNASTSNSKFWYEKPFYKGFSALLPAAQWCVMLTILVGGSILYYRDSNVAQASSLRDITVQQQAIKETIAGNKLEREQQIRDVRREMLPREIFEAYMKAIQAKQEEQQRLLEKILDKK